MDTKRSRVFLIDDYPPMRAGLRKLLEYEPDFEVCGEAGTIEDAVSGIVSAQPDVAVLDLILKGQNGIEVLDRLNRIGNKAPVLILSMLPEHLNIRLLLDKGAKGYLMKSEPPEEILRALRVVLRGEVYLSAAMGKLLKKNGDERHE